MKLENILTLLQRLVSTHHWMWTDKIEHAIIRKKTIRWLNNVTTQEHTSGLPYDDCILEKTMFVSTQLNRFCLNGNNRF